MCILHMKRVCDHQAPYTII
uniref:Uncharacterized protein n=1 Tax=Rhizophora mucronata TaxID=61149 RepID=A0A2P2IJB2_RHIMU